MNITVFKTAFFYIGGMLLSISMAFILPDAGATGGILKSDFTAKLGVFIIFIIQGYLVSSKDLKSGITELRLLFFVLFFNFFIIPIIGLLYVVLLQDILNDTLLLGILYLSILPTTISMAVVLTSQYRGNISAAIFCVTVSNFIGAIIVPFYIALYCNFIESVSISMFPLIIKVFSLILLPICTGQLIRRNFNSISDIQRKYLQKFNTIIIFFLVYTAYCNSIVKGYWETACFSDLIFTLITTLSILVIVKIIILISLKFYKFSISNQITAFFCASHKSLAIGIPMAQLIFNDNNTQQNLNFGMLLLPLMCYHPLQLILGSLLTDIMKKRFESKQ